LWSAALISGKGKSPADRGEPYESTGTAHPQAIHGMIVVSAGIVSQVMINSSDGFKAFAFFRIPAA
jgi:hypothetical protein